MTRVWWRLISLHIPAVFSEQFLDKNFDVSQYL